MRVRLLSLLLVSPLAIAAQEPDRSETIVVTGIAIDDYRARLQACLARACPPDADADATLALAEALMLEGEYRDARSAVSQSLRRNRERAGDYPEPVSDLYRAHARLSRHLGDDDDALRSTHNILNALQEGIAQEDHRHFTARLELVELHLSKLRVRDARGALLDLARIARRSGREDVAALAELRILLIEDAIDPRGRARRQLEDYARSTDRALRIRSVGARIALASLYRQEGDSARADAMLGDVARGGSPTRRLLHAPPVQLHGQTVQPHRTGSVATAITFGNPHELVDNFENKWVDIGFWVMPDGRVSGVEILRRGASDAWARPLLSAVGGRIYTPADEATYRMERYTLTAGQGTITRSRIARRTGDPRIEYLDLSVTDAPPPSGQAE